MSTFLWTIFTKRWVVVAIHHGHIDQKDHVVGLRTAANQKRGQRCGWSSLKKDPKKVEEPSRKFNCILFWFTSMVVRLHSCVLANQLSPVAHWSKSMFCMSTSTRITPLTQTNTHIRRVKQLNMLFLVWMVYLSCLYIYLIGAAPVRLWLVLPNTC